MNRYNSVGKISKGLSGGEARGETVAEADRKNLLPYRQSYEFDVFGNMTVSDNMHWGETYWAGQNFNKVFEHDNNRIDEPGWVYDADGRNTQSSTDTDVISRTFNAEGRSVRTVSSSGDSRSVRDGNGQEVKRELSTYDDEAGVWEAQPTKYYIRSSVLGGRVVSEIWANGRKHRSFVKGIDNETAVQLAYASESAALNELVLFEFSDSSGMSYRTTDKLGAAAASGDGGEGSPIETDPLGGSVGLYTPFITLIVP